MLPSNNNSWFEHKPVANSVNGLQPHPIHGWAQPISYTQSTSMPMNPLPGNSFDKKDLALQSTVCLLTPLNRQGQEMTKQCMKDVVNNQILIPNTIGRDIPLNNSYSPTNIRIMVNFNNKYF